MKRYHRLVVAFTLLVMVNFPLAAGYWFLNRGRTNPDGSEVGCVQSLYMTVISTFTVGYGEVVPIVTTWDRIYTMLVIGVGIAAKTHDIKLLQRIRNAGADTVVCPQFIGGLRLVSEIGRPTVVSFLDLMLRDRDAAMRVEEVQIQAGSPLAGKRLNEGDIAKLGLLVMAIQPPDAATFVYVPPPDAVMHPGCTLVVLGNAERVARLRVEASGAV